MPVSIRALAATAVVIAIAGCAPQTQSATPTPPTQSASASPIPLSAPPSMDGMSPHGMSPHGMSPHGMPAEAMPASQPEPPMNAHDPAVDKLVAAAKAAEAKSKARPADSTLKNAAADAYYVAGHEMMDSPKLHRKVKYRGALQLFREALRLNPSQEQAAGEKKLIEDIYRSMGRPIPE